MHRMITMHAHSRQTDEHHGNSETIHDTLRAKNDVNYYLTITTKPVLLKSTIRTHVYYPNYNYEKFFSQTFRCNLRTDRQLREHDASST